MNGTREAAPQSGVRRILEKVFELQSIRINDCHCSRHPTLNHVRPVAPFMELSTLLPQLSIRFINNGVVAYARKGRCLWISITIRSISVLVEHQRWPTRT